MAKKKGGKNNSKRLVVNDDSRIFAFVVTFLSIVGFIIALIFKRDDKYVMHYAKQSLLVFFAFVVAGASALVPFIGWLAYPVLYVISVALWIVSWVFALSGELKVVPLIGKYGNSIKL